MNQTTKIMKKFIILAIILPSLAFGQRSFPSAELGWNKDLLNFRKSNNLSLERDSLLDSLAKERFFAIASSLKNKDLGYLNFFSKFAKGNHGIEEIGLQSFNSFIRSRVEDPNCQEICCFIPAYGKRNDDQMLGVINSPANKGIINLYKSSPSHWSVVSSNLKAIQIERKYNGRLGKWDEVRSETVITNSKFGSYTGILFYEDVDPNDPNKRIQSTMVINISIFK
jgi:hypothetical protein